MAAGARPTIVLTGASGLIGRRICRALSNKGTQDVLALARVPETVWRCPEWGSTWQVKAVALDAPIDARVIPRGSTVVHLAAATGRATTARIYATNLEGTRRLLAAAAEAGAVHFIFMSSIAARYSDARWYPYATAKREAEALTAASGMPHSIVRPTIVLGPDSPLQRALTRLAAAPLPILFGRGDVRTQPVHVDDVAKVVTALTDRSPVGSVPLEVGGADCVTMAGLYQRLRTSCGLRERRPLRLPLSSLRVALARLEPLLGPVLPLTAGQLAVFANDSDATPNAIVRALLPKPLGLDAMLVRHGAP